MPTSGIRCSLTEQNYDPDEQELLAAIQALELWTYYLDEVGLAVIHNPNPFFASVAL